MRRILVLVFLAAAGCDTLGGAPGRLRTSASAYVAHVDEMYVEFEVPVTYTNTTGRTAYFHGCRPPITPLVEKRLNGGWAVAYEPIYLMCRSERGYPVSAGDTLQYTLHGRARLPNSNEDVGALASTYWSVGEVPGTYRLRWAVEERGEGRTVYSNEFRLTVADR